MRSKLGLVLLIGLLGLSCNLPGSIQETNEPNELFGGNSRSGPNTKIPTAISG